MKGRRRNFLLVIAPAGRQAGRHDQLLAVPEPAFKRIFVLGQHNRGRGRRHILNSMHTNIQQKVHILYKNIYTIYMPKQRILQVCAACGDAWNSGKQLELNCLANQNQSDCIWIFISIQTRMQIDLWIVLQIDFTAYSLQRISSTFRPIHLYCCPTFWSL